MDSRINMEPTNVQLSEPVDVPKTEYNPNRSQTWTEWAGEKIQWVRNHPMESLVLGGTGLTALTGTIAAAVPASVTACQNTGIVAGNTMDKLLRILSSKLAGEDASLLPPLSPTTPPPTTSAPTTTPTTLAATLAATFSTTACPACPTPVTCPTTPTAASNTTSNGNTTTNAPTTTPIATTAEATTTNEPSTTSEATTQAPTTTSGSTPQPLNIKKFELPELTDDEATFIFMKRMQLTNLNETCENTYEPMFKEVYANTTVFDDFVNNVIIKNGNTFNTVVCKDRISKMLNGISPYTGLSDNSYENKTFNEFINILYNDAGNIVGNAGSELEKLSSLKVSELSEHPTFIKIVDGLKVEFKKLELMDFQIRNMTEADSTYTHKNQLFTLLTCAQKRAYTGIFRALRDKINGETLGDKILSNIPVDKYVEAFQNALKLSEVCTTVPITTSVATAMMAGINTLAFSAMVYKVSRTKEEPREDGTDEENIPLNPVGQQNQPEQAGQAEPVNIPEEPQAPVQAEAQAEPQPEPQAEPQGAEARAATPPPQQQPPEMIGELMELNTSSVRAVRRGEALSAEDQAALEDGTAFNLAPAEGETHGNYRERLYNQTMQLAILERRTNGDNKGTVITFLGHIYKMRDHLNSVSSQYPFGDFTVDCAIKHVESMFQHGKLSERELQTLCEHYTYNLVDGYLEEKGEFEILKDFWRSAYDYGEEHAFEFINYMIGGKKA